MPFDWITAASDMDAVIDDTLGTSINIIPWNQGDPFKMGGPDTTRVVRNGVRAMYVSSKTALDMFPQMNSTQVTADTYVAIRTSLLGDVRQGDHVQVPYTDYRGEVAYITEGDTGRSLLHLLKVRP